MSAFRSRIRQWVERVLRRYMPVTWAWMAFGQQALATLGEGGG